MTEETRKIDIVLYYTRNAMVKPSEPKFEDIQKIHPDLDINSLLDIFSNNLNNYKKNIIRFNDYNDHNITSEFILITEDDNFIENVKKFEKNDFFIEWAKNSINVISETIKNIYK